jgi:diaminopimelate epimerase
MHDTRTRLAFTNMEGLGNAYLYVEEFDRPLENPAPLARKISDRHFGVGGDGLVLIGRSDKADFCMRIFNADGSEAEMCGNATRCVAKYLYDRGITPKTTVTLETLAGIRTLVMTVENGAVIAVRVDMGAPRLSPADISLDAAGDSFVNREIDVDGTVYRVTAVSMGNPHAVLFLPEIDSLDLPVLGPRFEHHPLFPRRTNTEFVQVLAPGRIKMRVWERGAGETLACGTGACAAAVAASLNGLAGRNVTVQLRGGELFIEWAEDGAVYKTGPAAFVFDGEYYL